MLIVEYYLPDGSMFYVDKITGHVPQKGDKVVHPFSQQAFYVSDVPEFWVARQLVKIQMSQTARNSMDM
jgi:hypothetical protein